MKRNPPGSFRFDQRRRCWSFHSIINPAVGLSAAGGAIEVNGRSWNFTAADSMTYAESRNVFKAVFRYRDPAFGLTLVFTPGADGRTLVLRGQIHNPSGQPLTLGWCHLAQIEAGHGGRLVLGDHPEQWLVFKDHDLSGRVCTLAANAGKHISGPMTQIVNLSGPAVLNAGFITWDRLTTRQLVEWVPREGGVRYDGCCDFTGWQLPAGKTVATETLRLELGSDPHGALARWAAAANRVYRPRLNPKTPVSWVGCSWVDPLSAREQPYEKIISGNAAAIRRRLGGFNIEHVWIGLNAYQDGIPGNWLEFDRRVLPGGLAKTIRMLKAHQLKPGFWIAPFWIFADARANARKNIKNILKVKDATGKLNPYVRKMEWPFSPLARSAASRFDCYVLDGTHPKSLAFIRKVFARHRRLGIRYYMLDFLGTGKGFQWHNPALMPLERIRVLMQEIRRAAGPDTHLLTAMGSSLLYIGCADAARISGDYGEGRGLYPPLHMFYNATFLMHATPFSDHRMLLRAVAGSYFKHRKIFINDCNLMTVDKPISRNNAEITATLFGMSGSPIMLGDDIRLIHPERLALIKKCLPACRSTAFPADLFTRIGPDDYPRVLCLPVKTAWGEYRVVAVFNLDKTAGCVRLRARELRLPAKTACRLYEFWREEYLGTFQDESAVELPPESCRVFRLEQVRRHPWILSTDMHLRQGAMELPELQWQARTLTLSGRVTRPQGETGNLFFVMPSGYRLINHEGCALAKDARDLCVIIRKPMTFTREVMPFKLRFARLRLELKSTAF